MNEKERWEVRFDLFKTILTSLSLIVSVGIFVVGDRWKTERENDLAVKRNNNEYQRRLWDERRNAYSDLASILGSIAADLDAKRGQREQARVNDTLLREFNKAYWGALILVENDEIEQQMLRLRNDLRDLEEGRKTSDQIKLRVQRIVDQSRQHILEGTGS